MATTPDNNSNAPALFAVIRYGLLLTSAAMLIMAVLTLAGVMPFPKWISMMFGIVAFVDLMIGVTVFGKRPPQQTP